MPRLRIDPAGIRHGQRPSPVSARRTWLNRCADRAARTGRGTACARVGLHEQRAAGWSPADGSRQLGKFELLEEIGVGSFGSVFRARDPDLDRSVAIKVLRAGRLASREDIDRFFREARSAAQLKHPGIVALYDTGQTDDGTCYLVEELIQGTTLMTWFRAGAKTFRELAELVARLAEALDYAHGQGVIHRDVKPSNIIIDGSGAAAS